ncbi:arylsulfatase I-like [Babylonia areolata]|uniref:arylsulfatase I-like n=1 Tax=Babylonia areolata TaxID=304850 RepID=UPI003FD000AC
MGKMIVTLQGMPDGVWRLDKVQVGRASHQSEAVKRVRSTGLGRDARGDLCSAKFANRMGKNTYDFRDNGRVAWEKRGQYSTELHTARVVQILRNSASRAARRPFFIYMAYQNAHSPFEAPERYLQYCRHVTNEKRRVHCAMVTAMDESIGNITAALDQEGLKQDTILLYLSDNGGPLGDGSFNWPLRGGKSSLWEGGTRSRTLFVYPRGLNPRLQGKEWGRAGNVSELHCLDGINQFHQLTSGTKGLRRVMVYNIDPTHNRSAVRIGNLKLLMGWWAPPDMEREGTATVPRQLYNVHRDPSETRNLYKRYQKDAKFQFQFQ